MSTEATTTTEAPATQASPIVDTVSSPSDAPTWPPLASDHALTLLHSSLPTLLSTAGNSTIWGVTLDPSSPPAFHTLLILQKFLRSEQGDVDKAKAKLEGALKWRKEFGLVGEDGKEKELVVEDEDRFQGLGYVTEVKVAGVTKLVTWNIYGGVKDLGTTFGDLDKFLTWRVALMELSLRQLSLATATLPIPDYGQGPDPYQMYQVHDYLNVSFLRADPRVKAASKATIELMGKNYPELLERKFFVNVPYVMGWLFSAMKLFVSAETVKKFTVLSEGKYLVAELGDPQYVPEVYGGKGPALDAVGTKA
ncbi:putative phosphatidylinositol transporter [Pseudohyphozyma bogoriensis]|nr:putative phosphatidylinositol transporter [Pseudohyphozyma bogoriensis]